MKKTAVVFGATGLVGETLVNLLISNEDYSKIILVIRKESDNVHPKVQTIVLADYSKLHQYKIMLTADDFFCCIGTTIKKAGSKEAFKNVDLKIPEYIARLAEELSVPNLVIVSSIGADAASGNFYLSTKGEMEVSVKGIYHGNLKFIRPSLLIGNRKEFRIAERISVIMMKLLDWTMVGPLRKYRGIHVSKLATAMIRATENSSSETVVEFN
jgi:uncharacterized protein YbjT (DUF2867 family)